MVFPTAEFCPNLSSGNDFRAIMIDYIREHFTARLGTDLNLLDLPNGLDLLSQKYGGQRREAVAAA